MGPERVREVVDARDGQLRVAYQHGQRQMGWNELCRLCEDAVVASGLPEGAMAPWTMEARVVAQSTQ